MNKRDKQRIQQRLARAGFVVEELNSWPAKATYYKPNGESLPNLPADPYSMKRYLRRGLTLTPPSSEVVPAERRYKHTRKFLKKQAQKIKVEKPINTLKGE